MPWFVADAVRIPAGIGQAEAEAGGVSSQPAELTRACEPGVEIWSRRRSDVEGAAGVVFAASRRGHASQDGTDVFPLGQFFTDDLRLPAHTAKSGDEPHSRAVTRGCAAHSPPGRGRPWRQPHDAAVVVPTDGDEPARLALQRHPARFGVISRNTEFLPDYSEPGHRDHGVLG